jgi:cell division protease FtsH
MLIDEAMDRRFQKKIYFKLPSQPERKEILEFYINKIDETLKGSINLDYIASITSGLSPAKLESIVKETSFMAIREKLIIDTDLLFKGFERITIGLTDRDESKLDRSRIIFHELGHFICEFDRHHSSGNSISEIKEHMKFLKISSESISKLGALGYVLNSEKDNKLSTRLDIEEEIIALYGGYAAENVYFSNGDGSLVSTGAYNDIEKVSKLLKTVVIDMGMYSKSKVNFGIIGLKNDESFIKEIESISEGLFDKAMERVKTHKALIDYLEPIIFERWVLSKDEIFEIIESFYKK